MKVFITTILTFIFISAFTTPVFAQNSSPLLIFSLDQGFGTGLIHKQDMLGLDRVIATFKKFQSQFQTYALINPMNLDQQKLTNVLDKLEENNIPFILDIYASDVLTIGGGNPSVAAPFDLAHGISVSIDRLTSYQQVYSQLKGIRIFEVFAMDFTLRVCRTTNPEWCEQRWLDPAANPFFDPALAETFVKFAKDNGLFVIWSDWHWNAFHSWDLPLEGYEQQLANLINTYPGTIITTYNNNEPNGQSRDRLINWDNAVNHFSGSLGIGLSDQAWLCDQDHMNCPISDLIVWADSAISKNAFLIEFEPIWYFYKFPRALAWDPYNYTIDPAWSNRGYPTYNLSKLTTALGVTIYPGDINLDNAIDTFDFNFLFSDYGKSGQLITDLDSDEKVNSLDAAVVLANFGRSL